MYDPERERAEPLTFSHTLALKPFALLSLKNGLLNLVTLTLYRFWGKTEVRRRVWDGVHMNGEPFEYTGRGIELFIGFLLAVAVVGLPFLVIIFGVQFFPPLLAAMGIAASYLLIGYLVGFGAFTAFRYAASRTTWRGVRFRLRGSANDFAWAAFGYSILQGLTWGWFTPAKDRRLARRLWGRLSFGDRKFAWSDSGQDLYPAFFVAWLGIIVAYFVFTTLFMVLIMFMAGISSPDSPPPAEAPVLLLLIIYPLGFLLALLIAVAFAPYRAALMRNVADSLRLDDARFRLRLGWRDMAKLTMFNVVVLVFTLGFAAPFVQARTVRFFISRLESEGEAQLAAARQTSAGPNQGEGLADAFGLSPI